MKKATNRQPPIANRQYYWIIGLTTVIVFFGLTMVTSASQIIAYSKYKDSLYFFKKQALYAVLGAGLFWLASRLDYRKLRQASWPLAISCIALLVMVFIPTIGHSAGGSTRWIPLGLFNLQPSELAKLGAVLLTVYLLDSRKQQLKDINSLTPFLVIVLMAILVIAQPDMGTTILLMGAAFVTLFMGGLPGRYLSGISVFGAFSFAGLIFIEPYRFQRLISFLRPQDHIKEGGFQIIQSLIAMGSGGIVGVGLAMSKQKFFFLPAAYTDFILAIIGEELGFLGTLGVAVGFVLLAICGFSIAYNAKDSYGRLLAAGLTVMIIIQALVNMGAVAGLLPVTGVPLPLISFGGSSMLVTMFALGTIASVARSEA